MNNLTSTPIQPVVITTARILAGCLNDVLWVRVYGKGSFDISPQLNRFATDRIAAGTRHLVIDLERCPTMDSTFMGTLTGIAVRLMDLPGGRLQVVNPNERNQDLLCNLGLDHIFEVDGEGRTWQEERAMISAVLNDDVCGQSEHPDRREKCQTMLEAHENLSRACRDNVPKFRDVIECLRQEMETVPA